jgi:hypothetical protein
MPKQQYAVSTKTRLTNALMRTYWGTNSTTGHTHTGTDVDGDCPRVKSEVIDTSTNIKKIVMALEGATGSTFGVSYIKTGQIATLHVEGEHNLTPATGFTCIRLDGVTALPADIEPLTGSDPSDPEAAHTIPCIMHRNSADWVPAFMYYDWSEGNFHIVQNSGVSGMTASDGWFPFSSSYITKVDGYS